MPKDESMINERGTLEKWRNSVDGLDETNRDVVYRTGVYYDQLIEKVNPSNLDEFNGVETVMLCSDFDAGEPHTYQLNLYSSSTFTAKIVYLFKQVLEQKTL